MNEMLKIHNEEIAGIKHFYIPPFSVDYSLSSFKLLLENIIINLSYPREKLRCIYISNELCYLLFIKHSLGETIIQIQIYNVINESPLKIFNNKKLKQNTCINYVGNHPCFTNPYVDSDIYPYVIELSRRKGIKEYCNMMKILDTILIENKFTYIQK